MKTSLARYRRALLFVRDPRSVPIRSHAEPRRSPEIPVSRARPESSVGDEANGESRRVPNALKIRARPVGGAVLDRHQLPGHMGVPAERRDAVAGVLELIEAGDDHRRDRRLRCSLGCHGTRLLSRRARFQVSRSSHSWALDRLFHFQLRLGLSPPQSDETRYCGSQPYRVTGPLGPSPEEGACAIPGGMQAGLLEALPVTRPQH